MEDSISFWIVHLKNGDSEAAQRLWEAYFHRLTGLARSRLGSHSKRMADEEDVALSVFDSLCRGATRGTFPKLSDRDNLWTLLVVMTARKVCDYVAAERAQKRGGGLVQAATDVAARVQHDANALDVVLSREPTPEMAATFAEQCEQFLSRLEPDLRELAVGKLDGYSNEELAARQNCGLRTVERRLNLIRRIWQDMQDGVP